MKWVGVGLIVKNHCISFISDFEDFLALKILLVNLSLTVSACIHQDAF